MVRLEKPHIYYSVRCYLPHELTSECYHSHRRSTKNVKIPSNVEWELYDAYNTNNIRIQASKKFIRTSKNELLETWKKFQAIRICKTIKEGLMMNRWHPTRVEKMLDDML